MRAVHVAEKLARYRHAQLSAIKLAGDINAENYNDATLDELLAKIRVELVKLRPLIDLDAIREAQGVVNRLPATGNGSEPEASSALPGLRGDQRVGEQDAPHRSPAHACRLRQHSAGPMVASPGGDQTTSGRRNPSRYATCSAQHLSAHKKSCGRGSGISMRELNCCSNERP